MSSYGLVDHDFIIVDDKVDEDDPDLQAKHEYSVLQYSNSTNKDKDDTITVTLCECKIKFAIW